MIAQLVKNLPAVQETPVHSLGWEDPQEKGEYRLQCSWASLVAQLVRNYGPTDTRPGVGLPDHTVALLLDFEGLSRPPTVAVPDAASCASAHVRSLSLWGRHLRFCPGLSEDQVWDQPGLLR